MTTTIDRWQGDHDEARIKHVLEIDIPAWQNGVASWFTVMLLGLIAKADTDNRERIRDGFPAEVEAYERWYRGAYKVAWEDLP